MLYFIIFFLFFLLLLWRIKKFNNKQKEFHEHEEAESLDEATEYEAEAELHESEDSTGIVDPYSRKKKGGYQTKNYRGTDIEVAGFESVEDLIKLKREEVTQIEKEDLKLEQEEKKPEVKTVNPEDLHSGIGGDKAREDVMGVEIKQNYRVKKEVSGIANQASTVGRLQKSIDKNNQERSR